MNHKKIDWMNRMIDWRMLVKTGMIRLLAPEVNCSTCTARCSMVIKPGERGEVFWSENDRMECRQWGAHLPHVWTV